MAGGHDDSGLPAVLRRLVDAACVIADAQYGALGVVGPGGELTEFVTHGVSEHRRRLIGDLPRGRGVLGLLIAEPRPTRLHDLTAHPAAVGFPEHHPEMHTFLGVPIVARSQVVGILYLAERRDGADFTTDDELLITSFAAAASVAIENARLYDAGVHRQRWLEASVEIEQQLLAGMPRESALAVVCERARDLAAADVASILLPDDDPEGARQLVVHAASGRASSAMTGARISLDRSVSGSVLRSGVPTDVAEFSRDPRVASIRGAPQLGPARIVPMVAGDRALGVLFVARRPGARALSREDGLLVDAFAHQAAIALELAELQDQRRGLAVYRDRERIARDLHDVVIQRIFGAGLTLQSVHDRLPEDLQERAAVVVEDLDAAIRDLRSAIFSLQRPPGSGLTGAIVDATRAAAAMLGFEPRLRLEGPLDTVVPEPVGRHVAPVLTEALTNVARHAQATSVTVLVRADAVALSLTVTDDGIGAPTRSTVPGNGLRNMRVRALELGGALVVDEPPDGGTRLHWWVPLPPPTGSRPAAE
jgi:signal transduction histidine kinase